MIFFRPVLKIPPEKRRIIISRTDKIGDLVLSIPAFYMARKMYPKAKIAVLVRKYNAGIVRHLSFIDETWIMDGNDCHELENRMKDFHADTFAALFSDNSVLKAAVKSGATIKTGPFSKPFSWFVYNSGLIQKRSKSIKSEAEYNLDIIRTLDPKLFDDNFEIGGRISCGKENIENAKNFLTRSEIQGEYILIHPFTGGSAKNLTDNQYVMLINKITAIAPSIDIVITSSADEFSRLENMKKNITSDKVKPYKCSLDILDLAALIEKSGLYVGGSTGPSHIAGNMKKKAVLIYPAKKSQSPVRWGLFDNENAEYVIPDKNNLHEDYSKKTFDNIGEKILDETALLIVNKFHTKL